MGSIRQCNEDLTTFVGHLTPPVPVSDYQRGFLEGITYLLQEGKTSLQATDTWNREFFWVDYLAHLQRMEAGIEQRLGLVAASTQAMAAGGPEAPVGGVREGST